MATYSFTKVTSNDKEWLETFKDKLELKKAPTEALKEEPTKPLTNEEKLIALENENKLLKHKLAVYEANDNPYFTYGPRLLSPKLLSFVDRWLLNF